MNISRKNFLVGAAATAITAPAVDGASLGGGVGRARGLLGGCFTGCMMAQHGGTHYVDYEGLHLDAIVDTTVSLAQVGSAPTVSLEYSRDATSWASWDGGEISIPTGTSLCLRATSSNSAFATSTSNYNKFVITGLAYARGKITSLLNRDISISTMSPYSFCRTFNNSDIASVPSFVGVITARYSFYECFKGCQITAVDMSGVNYISSYEFYGSFENNNDLQQIDFSGVVQIGPSNSMYAANKMLSGCTSLSIVSFPSLKKMYGDGPMFSFFQGCTNLGTVTFPALEELGGGNGNSAITSAFVGTRVTSLSFPSCWKVDCNTSSAWLGNLSYNTSIQKLYFPALTTMTASTNNTLYGCSNITEIHFGAANESAIRATSGFATQWGLGAGKATIYFDL